MGEALYDALRLETPQAACRIYAPVGGHRDLLAYLVRRLLENGANTSFVSVAADPDVPVSDILKRPRGIIVDAAGARHPKIPLPRDLYAPQRKNSPGIEFGHRDSLQRLTGEIRAAARRRSRRPRSSTAPPRADKRARLISDRPKTIGKVAEADAALAARAVKAAAAGFPAWCARSGRAARGHPRQGGAICLEASRGSLLALLQGEGGKTLDDARQRMARGGGLLPLLRRAGARGLAPQPMPGPTGESNELRYRGRGVFVCISPWNFPLAIFLGQVAAALAAGNAVVAKPAEQTPLIAGAAIGLLHEAGVPQSALQLVTGDGTIGAALVADLNVAGVAFTGSTQVGLSINRALAAKDGPIVPLIAETGGINAMIVDATALPEQVADDVVTSTFRSAGQRCSALRLLCLQDDVADRLIEMIAGAAAALVARRPARPLDACRAGDRCRGEGAPRRLDRRVSRRACAFAGIAGGHCRRAGISCRRPSSNLLARATCRKKCSARFCTSCAGAPKRSIGCSTRSPATAPA